MWFLVGLLLGLIIGAPLGAYGFMKLFLAVPEQAEVDALKLRAKSAEAVARIAQAGQAAQHQLLTQAFPEPLTEEERIRERIRQFKARRESA